ncbi:MAG TPA: methyltransferase [Gemmatimonadales bacterium]|nr:methyltransferase [Gemmatimonadales bacterium]
MAEPTPFEAMRQMIGGCLGSQLAYVAAKLGIADRLADGPKTAAQLAAAVGAHPSSLYRVLRALAAFGVFAEDADGRFSLTPLGGPLRRSAPDSLHAYALLWGDTFWPAWGSLLHCVRTGQTAFDHLYGMDPFEYLRQHPQAAEVFDEAMSNLTRIQATAVLAAYDFSGIGSLVDVGGGKGTLLAAVLRSHPEMRGVLYERPEVLPAARKALEAEGVLARCELKRGDFFASVPEGGDAYMLKDVVHDWDDEQASLILANCARAMGAQSRLLVIERGLPPGNVMGAGKIVDVVMLAITGGRERTEPEYADLLSHAGLRVARVVPTTREPTVIEAVLVKQ